MICPKCNKEVPIDIRIISSTNETPAEAMRNRHIREDLLYRLSVVPITIPPLRERKGDIPLLVQYFIEQYNKRFQKRVRGVDDCVMDIFMTFSWPGNIRELRNIVERAVIISSGDEITPDALHLYTSESHDTHNETPAHILEPVSDLKTAMEKLELEYINRAYDQYGNVRDAAASLGMSASTFVRKRQRFLEQ